MKRIILVLAIAAIVATMAALGGGPAVAAKAGDIGVLPDQGEPDPSCKGIVKAAEKSGRENLKAMTGERGCGPPGPPKV